MDALNADEVQSYLHAPEFGKKAALGETPVLRRHGASGQVAPEAVTLGNQVGRPHATEAV